MFAYFFNFKFLCNLMYNKLTSKQLKKLYFFITDKGIPQIKQNNIQPPDEDRLQVEFSQTPPSVVEAENCTNGECQVQVHIKSNKQNIEYDGVYIKKEDDTDLYHSMEVSQGQSSEGEYHYTLTFSIPKGKNNIVIVFKSDWQYAGLSFQIECICSQETHPQINWHPDKPPTDTTTENTAKLNIKSDQILD